MSMQVVKMMYQQYLRSSFKLSGHVEWDAELTKKQYVYTTTTTVITATTTTKTKVIGVKLSENIKKDMELNHNTLCTCRLSERHNSNISRTA